MFGIFLAPSIADAQVLGIQIFDGHSDAVVLDNTRVTLNAYTPYGTVTYKGIPMVDLPDIDGNYSAEGTRNKLKFFEFFTLEQDDAVLNSYDITGGIGPNYMYAGWALLSRQNQIAFYTLSNEETPLLSTYIGPFKTTTRRGKLTGANNQPSYGRHLRPAGLEGCH